MFNLGGEEKMKENNNSKEQEFQKMQNEAIEGKSKDEKAKKKNSK